MRGNNTEAVKRDNSRNILNTIYMYGPISRIEISQMLRLTPPTITGYVSTYLQSGLIEECVASQPSEGAVGRRRVALDFVPDAAYMVGVDIGPHATYMTIINVRGKVMFRKRLPMAPSVYEETVSFVADGVLRMIGESGLDSQKIAGMGIGIPGYVDQDGLNLIFSSNYGWKNAPFAEDIRKATGLKTVLLNNARARSITCEMFSGMDIPDAYAYILVAKGIASPCVVGSHELMPHHVSPGEMGHMVVDRYGKKCPVCGNNGCLETLSSETGILDHCRELWSSDTDTVLKSMVADPAELTIEDVLDAQREGDAAVGRIINNAISYLGIAIANLINIFNPPLVVVDAHIMENEENRELLRQYAYKNLYVINEEDFRLEFVPFEKYRTAEGAAGYAIKRFIILDGAADIIG